MAKDRIDWAEDFYDEVEEIALQDPLAVLLGAVKDGSNLVYTYKDAVLMAGHSCPAVAGAYKATAIALKKLYGSSTPVRGEVRIVIKGKPDDLAYGPQSQVMMLITGASGATGFKGLGNRYSRKDKLRFDDKDPRFNTYIFEREDTGKAVEIRYNPQAINDPPRLGELSGRAISGRATKEEAAEFKTLWQEKIRKILISTDEFPGLFEVRELKGKATKR
jgi:formylmethanofuran dehydrogenase subunit E